MLQQGPVCVVWAMFVRLFGGSVNFRRREKWATQHALNTNWYATAGVVVWAVVRTEYKEDEGLGLEQ